MPNIHKMRGKNRSAVAEPDASAEVTAAAPYRSCGLSDQIIWDFVSINSHLEDIRSSWAKLLGISGPQWLILMAINDLDQGGGVSVGDVSAKTHAVSTLVTKQTKTLEKLDLVIRVPSTIDARVVLMSLSPIARQQIADLSARWEALHAFIFRDFDAQSLNDVKDKLELLKKRTKTAATRVLDEYE